MKKYIYSLFILITALAPFFITSQFKEPIMLDYGLIIQPLESMKNLSDLYYSYINHTNFDIQPLRDLSHLIDIQLSNDDTKDIIPLVHNILLYLFTAFLLLKNFTLMGFKSRYRYLLVTIFLVHPAIFHIYVEFTARKHILSFLFIQASIYFYLKSFFQEKKDYILSYFFYFFALLSQPINALGFIHFFFHQNKINLKKRALQLLPFALTLIFFFALNRFYYSLLYDDTSKYVIDMNIYKFFIASAFYLRQLFLPYSFAAYYDYYSNLLIIYLLISPLFYYFVYKLDKSKFIMFCILTAAPYLTLYGTKTNIYSDLYFNYYLLPFFFIFLLFINLILEKFPKTYLYMKYLLPIILGSISIYYATLRVDKFTYYKNNLKLETHCKTLEAVLMKYIELGDINSLVSNGNLWLSRQCLVYSQITGFQYGFIFSHLIYIDQNLSIKEKTDLFEKKYTQSKDLLVLKIGLLINNKYPDEEIQSELKKFDESEGKSFFLFFSFIRNTINQYCSQESMVRKDGCLHYTEYKERTKNIIPNLKMKNHSN